MNSTEKVTVEKEITEEDICGEFLSPYFARLEIDNEHYMEDAVADILTAGCDLDVVLTTLYKALIKSGRSDAEAKQMIEYRLEDQDGKPMDYKMIEFEVETGLLKISESYRKKLGKDINDILQNKIV